MQYLKHITSPTLLVNKQICKKNILDIAEKAKRNNLVFRPHFKTHVSLEMGEWFREFAVDKITVSSMQMAIYFANGGWNDISLAFPVNIREITPINQLAKRIQLNLVVENQEVVDFLEQHLEHEVAIYIKIDVGAGRTGLAYDDIQKIKQVLTAIQEANSLQFKGFLAHAGQTYEARGLKDIQMIHEQYAAHLIELKNMFPEAMVSIGDTPSCSRMEDFTWADEMRPGNFIFYDVMQWIIGSCQLDDIAVAMACPIVAKHKDRNELIVHGGAVHFAKDISVHPFLKKKMYGLLVELNENAWSHPSHKGYLSKLSQEHGTIKVSDELFEKYNIGDLIGILPIHSCMTADCMRKYMDFDGNVIFRM